MATAEIIANLGGAKYRVLVTQKTDKIDLMLQNLQTAYDDLQAQSADLNDKINEIKEDLQDLSKYMTVIIDAMNLSKQITGQE